MDREKLIDIKDKILDKLTDLGNAWVAYRYSTDNSDLIEYQKKDAKRDAEKAARRAAAKEAAEGKNAATGKVQISAEIQETTNIEKTSDSVE